MAFTLAYQGPEGACSEQVVLEYGPRHSGSRTDPPSMTPLRRSTDRPRRSMCWVPVPGAGPILDRLVLERVFRGATENFDVWKEAGRAQARLIWEGKSSNAKLSDFAEEFFRRLATLVPERPMLLRKNTLHRLIRYADPSVISREVQDKLDLVEELFGRQ